MRVPGWVRLRIVLASTVVALAASLLGAVRLLSLRKMLVAVVIGIAVAIAAMPV